MLNNKTVAVVIPAFNESSQIKMVIDSMPAFIDKIVVVDDGSVDDTAEIVGASLSEGNVSVLTENILERHIDSTIYNRVEIVYREKVKEWNKLLVASKIMNETPETDRIILIRHNRNSGVGAAVATGYRFCRDHGIDCVAKVDGDGQMDPNELERICKPVVNGNVDYVKGNRLNYPGAWFLVPRVRYIGNSVLSILTKLSSGYWRISDTQTAFSAISGGALRKIQIHKLYRSYGYPNDILVKLNMANCRICEVSIKPVYDIGEKSKMKIGRIIPKISYLLFKSFWKRIVVKYLVKEFHPLFLLYLIGIAALFISVLYFGKIAFLWITALRPINELTILAFLFTFLFGFQSLLFAMWMDMQVNDNLYKEVRND